MTALSYRSIQRLRGVMDLAALAAGACSVCNQQGNHAGQ